MKTISLLLLTFPFVFTSSDNNAIIIKKTNSPIYTLIHADLFKVNDDPATNAIIYNNSIVLNTNDNKSAKDNQKELLKRGNKAYIEIPDEESRAGEKYFVNALKKWKYWKIVTNKKAADFIIVFNIDKKAMLYKTAAVTFKTRNGKAFKKSKSYRTGTSVVNGYNAFYGVANKIVDKYFKKEFK